MNHSFQVKKSEFNFTITEITTGRTSKKNKFTASFRQFGKNNAPFSGSFSYSNFSISSLSNFVQPGTSILSFSYKIL